MTAPNVTPTPSAPPNPASTSATPSTGMPPATVSTGVQETGFRYTAAPNVPDFLVGKTSAEAAELMNQLYLQNQKLAQASMAGRGAPTYPTVPTPNYPPNYAPGYQPPQYAPQQGVTKPTPEDFLNRPAEATEQYANYLEQTRWNPQFQATAASQAKISREMVALRRPDDFRKYGPEIDMTLQQVAPDPTTWTTENINHVVDMVRGRHVEDLIAEERAKHSNALGGVSARPDTGGAMGTSPSPGSNIDLDKLPTNFQAALKRLNLDQHGIDEFLNGAYVKTGMEPNLDAARQRWTTQASRGDIVTDGKEYLSGIYQ